jgi:DNA invertase Pin-like site-specific DNA recombinase
METSCPKAYSYVRYSSKMQENGDSTRRQIELSEKYAQEHGLDLDENLRMQDDGVSAFDGSNVNKGELSEFLKDIEAGRVAAGAYLLVESLDRLSRADVLSALRVFMAILEAGIVIVTMADRMVYSKERVAQEPMSLMMSILVMIRANEESQRKSERVHAAWAAKQRKASSEKVTRTCPSWLRLSEDRKAFEIIEEKAVVVRRILKLQREGVGQATIVKMLNREEVPVLQERMKKRQSKGWHASTIQKLINHPALYGAYQPTSGGKGKVRKPVGEPVEGYYPALIDKAEFDDLRHQRADRATRGRGVKGKGFANLFSGLLHCAYCGSTMNTIGYVQGGKERRRSIVCANAKRGRGCHFLGWDCALFERHVLAFCEQLDFSTLFADGQERAVQGGNLATRVASLRAELSATEAKTQNLLALVEGGGQVVPASVLQRIQAHEQQAEQLRHQIAEAEREQAEVFRLRQSAGEIKRSIVDLFKHLDNLEGEARYFARARLSAEIRRVVQRIDVYPGGWFMTQEDFINGHPDEDHEDPRWRALLTPDKKSRFAMIGGVNGKSMGTKSPDEARFKSLPDKAELLEALGL